MTLGIMTLNAYAECHYANSVHCDECRGTYQRHCYFEKQLDHLNNFRSLGTMQRLFMYLGPVLYDIFPQL